MYLMYNIQNILMPIKVYQNYFIYFSIQLSIVSDD